MMALVRFQDAFARLYKWSTWFAVLILVELQDHWEYAAAILHSLAHHRSGLMTAAPEQAIHVRGMPHPRTPVVEVGDLFAAPLPH